MVWGTALWSSTPNKTKFVKKFEVVPKFWSKVWRHALCQPVTKKSMAKTDFCELSDITSQQTFPWNFEATWNFSTNDGLIVAELRLADPLTSCGLYSTYILITRRETKCILSFGVGCTSNADCWLLEIEPGCCIAAILHHSGYIKSGCGRWQNWADQHPNFLNLYKVCGLQYVDWCA